VLNHAECTDHETLGQHECRAEHARRYPAANQQKRAYRLSAGRHRSSAGAYVDPEGKIGLVACDDDGLPGFDRLRGRREIAGRMGSEIVKVYKDHGISGTRGRNKRPAFDKRGI
jgi:hypothetical protein